MSIGAILTVGLGTFGSVNLLPTLGYSSGAAPATTTRRHPGYDARAEHLRAIQRDDEEILALVGAAIRTLQ